MDMFMIRHRQFNGPREFRGHIDDMQLTPVLLRQFYRLRYDGMHLTTSIDCNENIFEFIHHWRLFIV